MTSQMYRFSQTIRETISRMRGSVLGIDIGTWSTKIVQLRKEHDELVLESYGDIRMAPYVENTAQTETAAPEHVADAVLDLMYEVRTSSRNAGISVPTPTTFLTVIETPIRDAEQMNNIIPNEAKKYIPTELKDVILNWFVLPEDNPPRNAFDMMTKGSTVSGNKMQKVLIAAINADVVKRYDTVLRSANLSPLFYEIEAFSGLRAAPASGAEPVLYMDCGASITRLYVVEHNMIRMSHMVNTGGIDVTHRLSGELNGNLEDAEYIKCTQGLMSFPLPEKREHKVLTHAMTSVLDTIAKEAHKVISEYKKTEHKSISHSILFGGGSRLPYVDQYFQSELGISVEVARPFGKTRGPRVLEGSLFEAGPVFAGAIGLAMRAAQEKESVISQFQTALQE